MAYFVKLITGQVEFSLQLNYFKSGDYIIIISLISLFYEFIYSNSFYSVNTKDQISGK